MSRTFPSERHSNKTGTLLHEDQHLRTLFIGGIPLLCKRDKILSYLSQFDEVESLSLPTHTSTGELKGFSKVILKSHEGVERILSLPNHHLLDLTVGISRWKQKTQYLAEKDNQATKRVHVKTPPHISESELMNYFKQFGPVDSIAMKTDPYSGKYRNFCYIDFNTLETALAAVSKKYHSINSFIIECEFSRPAYLVRLGFFDQPYKFEKNKILQTKQKRITHRHLGDTMNPNLNYSKHTNQQLDKEINHNFIRHSHSMRFNQESCQGSYLLNDLGSWDKKHSDEIVYSGTNPVNNTDKVNTPNVHRIPDLFSNNKMDVKPTSKNYHQTSASGNRLKLVHEQSNLLFSIRKPPVTLL